jgi:Membrane domain of glycerophosphoryl diester phosphodiesterase
MLWLSRGLRKGVAAMKLDTNQAWQEASAMVSANRQVLVALAGVFFVLPGLALSLFFPEPQPDPKLPPKELFAVLGEYYKGIAPWTIPVLIASSIGILALLTLFADRSRPTVSEAIRQGASGFPSYIGSQLITTLGFALAGGLVAGIAVAAGSVGLGIILVSAVLLAAIYFGVRFTLAGPVVAVEGVRNPVAALRRSWKLTQDNVGRILIFFMLITLAFIVVIGVIMAITGVVLAVTVGGEPARVVAGLVSSVLTGVYTVYLTACLGAIHRQLTDEGRGGLSQTFE